MAKAIADQHWETYRYFKHASTTPSAVLQEVLNKLLRERQTHIVEPKSLLGPVSERLLSEMFLSREHVSHSRSQIDRE